MADEDEDPSTECCGKCKKVCKSKENAVCCEGICEQWFHANCVGINTNKYLKINDIVDIICWICKDCIKLIVNMRLITKRRTAGSSTLDISKTLENIQESVQNLSIYLCKSINK